MRKYFSGSDWYIAAVWAALIGYSAAFWLVIFGAFLIAIGAI